VETPSPISDNKNGGGDGIADENDHSPTSRHSSRDEDEDEKERKGVNESAEKKTQLGMMMNAVKIDAVAGNLYNYIDLMKHLLTDMKTCKKACSVLH
jgi:hypothetical protein